MEPIATKDIAIAVVSGSAAIASMLLVFVGFMIMKIQGLSDSASVPKIQSYTRTAQLGLVPIVTEVGVIVTAYAWLFSPNSQCLYRLWSIGFIVGLGLFLLYAIYATLRL